MKSFGTCVILLLSLAICPHTRAGDTDTLWYGPHNNRVDYTFLGFGWGEEDAQEMKTELNEHVESFFNIPVYKRYKNFFNVYVTEFFKVIPGGVTQNYSQGARQEYEDAHTSQVSNAEVRYTVVNGSGAGQSYGGNLSWTSNNLEDVIGTHELGHGWHVLADIYGGMSGEWLPNRSAGPDGAWDHWLGYVESYNGDVVGVYPVQNANSYRPVNSTMTLMGDAWENNSRFICYTPVGREKVVQDIYEFVDPLDSYDINNPILQNPASIKVKTVDPQVIHVDWYVDDQLVAENGGEVFNTYTYIKETGDYTVTANAYDEVLKYAFSDRGGTLGGEPGSSDSDSLDWVRTDLDNLQQSVTWNVTIDEILSAGDLKMDLASSRIRKINSDGITLELPQKSEYSLDVYSLTGKKIRNLARGESQLSTFKILWAGREFAGQMYYIQLKTRDRVTGQLWFSTGGKGKVKNYPKN